MTHRLTLEVSDEAYEALRREAEETGMSPARVAADTLEQRFSLLSRLRADKKRHSEAERQAARERFEGHFGAVNLGYATGADNESIDLDLAREYMDPHEDD